MLLGGMPHVGSKSHKLTAKNRKRFVQHFPVLHFPVLHFQSPLGELTYWFIGSRSEASFLRSELASELISFLRYTRCKSDVSRISYNGKAFTGARVADLRLLDAHSAE